MVLTLSKWPCWEQCQGRQRFNADRTLYEFWYGDGPFYVRLLNFDGTLAGDIIRFEKDIPQYGVNLEINGDAVKEINAVPWEEPVETTEDLSAPLAQLPTVTSNPSTHFTKRPSHRSEIENLLKCRGLPHVIQLVGKTADGQLVFPKMSRDLHLEFLRSRQRTATQVKTWLLQMIDCVAEIHSRGVIHHDLNIRHFLVNDKDSDARHLVVSELEGRSSSATIRAPELYASEDNASPASDVYALGRCIWGLCYNNNPRNLFIQNSVPPPFDAAFAACTQSRPEDRPTLDELRKMVEAI